MFGGLIALLDDVAALAKAAAASLDDMATLTKAAASSIDDVAAGAAKASTKALGVVIDDTAVAPQYFVTIQPKRELPMVWRIVKGSLRNKLLFILPAIIILSIIFPAIFSPLLIVGGSYLSFEGAEKIWHKLHGSTSKTHGDSESGRDGEVLAGAGAVSAGDGAAIVRAEAEDADREGSDDAEKNHAQLAQKAEDRLVKGVITTDLILSCEIMLIAFNSVLDQPLLNRILIMITVAIIITAGVYGVVALIIKMDDIGLSLARTKSGIAQKIGRSLVSAMPKVMACITVVGTVAMLWVGGHLIISGLSDMGVSFLYSIGEFAAHLVKDVAAVGSVLAWLAETLWSAICGVVFGSMIRVVVMAVEAFVHKRKAVRLRAAR